MLGLSIIVPVLNEYQRLPDLVNELEKVNAEQVIIVDGGSTDGSVEWLQQNWQSTSNSCLVSSDAGRAKQMNAGACSAEHEMLLFVHADTILPSDTKQRICQKQSSFDWGRFDVAFDLSSPAWQATVMQVVAYFMNQRSRMTSVATGDQAIFVHRHLFDQVNGFDDIALMEDVAISKKLRKLVKPRALNDKVITSARRWQKNGIFKTILTMWWYRLVYFFGVSPDYLAQKYRNVR